MLNLLDSLNLPKPFSVMDEKGNYLSFLIKIVGSFTEKISSLKYGDSLLIRGPYGVPIINKIDLTKKIYSVRWRMWFSTFNLFF